jgi:hypothetical protein
MAQLSRISQMWADEALPDVQQWDDHVAIQHRIIRTVHDFENTTLHCAVKKCNCFSIEPASVSNFGKIYHLCPRCNHWLRQTTIYVNELFNDDWLYWEVNGIFLAMAYDDMYDNGQWLRFQYRINRGDFFGAYTYFSGEPASKPAPRAPRSLFDTQDCGNACKKRKDKIKQGRSSTDHPQQCLMAAKTLDAFMQADWNKINTSSYMGVLINTWANRAVLAENHYVRVRRAIDQARVELNFAEDYFLHRETRRAQFKLIKKRAQALLTKWNPYP